VDNPADLLNKVVETDPVGSLPFLMPGRANSRPGDVMMLDQYMRWGPADAFGDHLLQPYGYQRIPAGFMMQWGTTDTIPGYGYYNSGGGFSGYNSNNSVGQSFYKAFSYMCFGVYGNGTNSFTYNSNYGTGTYYAYNTDFPSAGFTFSNLTRWGFTISNNTPIDMACRWFAVGH